jgi:hypothetical protein
MVMFRCTDRRASVHLSNLQDGAWGEVRDSDIIELPEQVKDWNRPIITIFSARMYMMCMAGYILGVDSSSVSLFCIKLPNGVRNGPNLGLSCADGSRLCLINVSEYKVHVWHHTVDCESTGNWTLIDTVCLRQAFGHLADPTWYSQDDIVRVDVVGDNDDFVFLRVDHSLLYVYFKQDSGEGLSSKQMSMNTTMESIPSRCFGLPPSRCWTEDMIMMSKSIRFVFGVLNFFISSCGLWSFYLETPNDAIKRFIWQIICLHALINIFIYN